MIVVGIILLLVGYRLPAPAYVIIIGWIVLVIGIIHLILGRLDRPAGGRRGGSASKTVKGTIRSVISGATWTVIWALLALWLVHGGIHGYVSYTPRHHGVTCNGQQMGPNDTCQFKGQSHSYEDMKGHSSEETEQRQGKKYFLPIVQGIAGLACAFFAIAFSMGLRERLSDVGSARREDVRKRQQGFA